MPRLIRLPGLLLLAAVGCAVATVAAAADNAVIKRFTRGDGANSVGFVDASKDTELVGPDLCGPNGERCTDNERANSRFDPKGPSLGHARTNCLTICDPPISS